MKKVLLTVFAILLLFLVNGGAQTPFSATYTFSGTSGNVASFDYNGSAYDGIVPGSFVKVGVTSTSSTNNFRANSWPLGATSGSDVFTGSIDLAKYLGFTIDAASGYKFTVTSISFGIGRSATGIRQCEWRGNGDSFGSAIDNYSALNAGLSNSSGTLTNPDANSSWLANVLDLPSDYSDLTTTAEFRLYLFNAEAAGGTAGLQGAITISGTYESNGAPIPTIIVSNSSLSGFTYSYGSGPSTSQSFTVSGSDLTDNISVAATTNYEISNDNTNFQSTPITLIQTGGTVTTTTIYARLKSGLAVGNYNGEDISASSTGASSKTVTCDGNVQGLQYANIPYTENFNSCSSHKWNIQSIASDRDWSCGSGNMTINGYGGSAASIDYLVSPSFNLNSYTHEYLSFTSYTKYADAVYPPIELLYSTNYIGDASTATWTPVSATWSAENSETSTLSGDIDISAITGTNVSFAFRYTSTGTGAGTSALWSIDDFAIKQNAAGSTKMPNAWINEIHYDNNSTDVDEMIEIVIDRADTLSLSDFTVSLYNGGDGTVYDTKSLTTFTAGNVEGDFSIFYLIYPANGLQNGPDGISLDWKGTLVQFLSYEGTFTGSGGPADGIVSADLGVYESSTKPVGQSLQLIGTGLEYSNFYWVDPAANPGAINAGQVFGTPPPPVPIDWRVILLTFVLIAGLVFYRKLR